MSVTIQNVGTIETDPDEVAKERDKLANMSDEEKVDAIKTAKAIIGLAIRSGTFDNGNSPSCKTAAGLLEAAGITWISSTDPDL